MVLPLIAAPTAMLALTAAERRFGPTVAGWFAAAPITIVFAVLAVGADLGPHAVAELTSSAASRLGAQVGFAALFSIVLLRRGITAGLAAGTAAFVALSTLLAMASPHAATAAGALAVVVATRRLPSSDPVPIEGEGRSQHSRRHRARPEPSGVVRVAVVRAGVALAAVAAILGAARLASPQLAGAIGAFPALSGALVVLIARDQGPAAGAAGLRGLVLGLPGYAGFCLAAGLAAPLVGVLPAVPAGLVACGLVYRLTWRAVNGSSSDRTTVRAIPHPTPA